jgi:hypothetical protein
MVDSAELDRLVAGFISDWGYPGDAAINTELEQALRTLIVATHMPQPVHDSIKSNFTRPRRVYDL